MFERFFSWRAYRKFKKQEKLAQRKYQEHFSFDDGRVLHVYSNEIIEPKTMSEVSIFMQENFDRMDKLSMDISDIAVELVMRFFSDSVGASIYVVEPRKEYVLTIISFA